MSSFWDKKASYFIEGFIFSFFLSIFSAASHVFTQPTLGIICVSFGLIWGIGKQSYNKITNKEKFDILNILASSLGGAIFFFA
jgi:hypothetical protein